jgi:hypothetical protein
MDGIELIEGVAVLQDTVVALLNLSAVLGRGTASPPANAAE